MALVFAAMHLYKKNLSIPFFSFLKKNSDIDLSIEWSTVPACVSLMCFFFFKNRAITRVIPKGLILRHFCVWCMCVYALFCVNLYRD